MARALDRCRENLAVLERDTSTLVNIVAPFPRISYTDAVARLQEKGSEIQNPADPRTVLCNDMIAPEGYGEIIGGSKREDDLDELLGRIREEGLPEEAYDWYLDLRRYGSFVHSGFGLSIERTVTWITGRPRLREAIPFPRMMNRLHPSRGRRKG